MTLFNKFAPLALLALLATGCGASDKIVQGIDIAVNAAEVALPILEAGGQIPAPLAPTLSAYLGIASGSLADTITELGSTDSGVIKAEKIRGYLTAAVLPDISKLSPTVQVYFAAVDAAIQALLKEFQKPVVVAAIRLNVRTKLPSDAMAHLAVMQAKALHVKATALARR